MLDMWISGSDGFILVYSITDPESFESTKDRVIRIQKNKGTTDTIVVAGNKCDLESDRKVDTAYAQKYCKENGLEFMECSAKNDINAKEIFLAAAKLLLKKKFPDKFNDEPIREKKNCFCF